MQAKYLFDSIKDLIYNLGNFLFEYNHLRRKKGNCLSGPLRKVRKSYQIIELVH